MKAPILAAIDWYLALPIETKMGAWGWAYAALVPFPMLWVRFAGGGYALPGRSPRRDYAVLFVLCRAIWFAMIGA